MLPGTEAPPVLGMIGERVTLPCRYEEGRRWQVSDLRILWQTATDLVVHAQYGVIEENNAQDSRYRNRTSLLVEQISKGDLSLQLDAVNAADGGSYQCIVLKKGLTRFRKVKASHVSLITAANYSLPVISGPAQGEIGLGEEVNLTCSSFGGYPAPAVSWVDCDGRTLPEDAHVDTFSSEPGSGLYNVTSVLQITATRNTSLSCAIFNKSTQERKTSFPWKFLLKPILHHNTPTKFIGAIIIAVLIIFAVGIAIYLWRRSRNNYRVARVTDAFVNHDSAVNWPNRTRNSDVSLDHKFPEAMPNEKEKINIQQDSV
ncbi:CD276 antigen-like isoform X2 [Stegostoma tigrinum]|uniref:CD276 antigen-like isoform X2 n=1 Tax=Stegostoma tigrinum TaxID=3053191 RepID=UPI0028700016|nr:CD276 antigen-like isoform X2 [Stegostoma tigrinum]